MKVRDINRDEFTAKGCFAYSRAYAEKTILLRDRKTLLDTDLKIILLDHQNNFVGTLKIMSNARKNFDILATSLSILHNYFDGSNYFSDLYSAKILDLSTKLPVPSMYVILNRE